MALNRVIFSWWKKCTTYERVVFSCLF